VRFIIYGAGAIGGAIGGRLAEAGNDVVLIARGAHYEGLHRNGLTLESADRTITQKVPVVADPSELTFVDEDVVVFAMKTQHTEAATKALEKVAPRDVVVVSAQNGVENERVLIRRFANVYGICVMCPAAHLEPGIVQTYSSPITGLLDIGRWAQPVDNTAIAISDALRASTFESVPRDDIARWKYGKLLMNLGNAVEALCGHVDGIGPVMRLAREEAVGVLGAAGIAFVDRDEDRERRDDLMTMGEIAGRPRGGGSSWQSLARATGNVETDYLNGEIVMLGRLHGVATPVNELLQRRAGEAAEARTPPGSVDPTELLGELDVAST
jgi:2-dehydropantoate 2-reductase